MQIPALQPGASHTAFLPLAAFQNVAPPPPSSVLQVAVKNNQQPVWYFVDKVPAHAFFLEDGRMEKGVFLEVRGMSTREERCICSTVFHKVQCSPVHQVASSWSGALWPRGQQLRLLLTLCNGCVENVDMTWIGLSAFLFPLPPDLERAA